MRVITGYLQSYDWGVPGGLAKWRPDADADSCHAELWFGAHPNGPSPLGGLTPTTNETLADVLAPAEVPVLVKLLAAARPLSIQVHPPARMAAELMAQGSPLVADALGKVEMLVALEPFSIFAGWRDGESAARLLAGTDAALAEAAELAGAGDAPGALAELLDLPGYEVQRLIPLYLESAAVAVPAEELRALALCAESHPGDVGVLLTALLDFRQLRPGEAVFLPPGGVHAYVQGFGIEVMTASDNVLRLGMTTKEVAVAQALRAVDANGTPHFLGGDAVVDHGHAVQTDYRPVGAPFALDLLRTAATTAPSGGYRCVVNIAGDCTVASDAGSVSLQPGEAAVVLAGEPEVTVSADGTAIVVTHLAD